MVFVLCVGCGVELWPAVQGLLRLNWVGVGWEQRGSRRAQLVAFALVSDWKAGKVLAALVLRPSVT